MSLEAVAVVLTLVAVYLTAREIVWCWPLGMVSVVLYAKVFYDARLYAEMGLQGLYFGLAAYGWWAWLHGGEDHGELRVSRTELRIWFLVAIAATLVGTGLGQALTLFTNASLPFMDSLLASFSVAAQWMQTRKLLESWLVWIAVDVLYVGMFAYKALYLTAVLYSLFLVLAAMGFTHWRRSMRGAHVPATPELVS